MNFKRLKFLDKPFIITLLIIVALGLVIQSSASSGMTSDGLYYVKKQLFMIGLGLLGAIFVIRYDFAEFKSFALLLYLLSVGMLIAVLAFGTEVRGTTGWISLGPLPAVQPAEFTKVMLIIAFADFVNRRRGEMDTLMGMLPCFAYMGLPFILIMMQPDLGTALVYIAITVVMMFVAGANPKLLIALLAGGILVIVLVLFLHFNMGLSIPLEEYQIKRLTVFVDPYNDGQGGRGAGWNTIQSLVAIGSGGLTGKGLYNGTQVQLNFLPEHHTDFIYAVIGEELGFIGAAFLILLYGILILRALYIASESREFFGSLIVVGVTAMWLFHIFENIGMSIGLMPITGIPLPFISYGGSSMITNLIAVALVVNINIRGKQIVF